jgi:hypothetical protein
MVDVQESVSVNNQEISLLKDQETVLLKDQEIGLLNNDAVFRKSLLATSKITLSLRLRELMRFYNRFKVIIHSSLNFVILFLVLPVNELLADSVIAALIET